MTERTGWTAATVGCHWFYGERLGVVSTFVQGQRSGYTAAVDRERIGEFETLTAAQEAVERTVQRDARLVAAAPDMLEALKLLQAALSQHRLLDVRKRFSLSVAHAAAGKAIAKVEGDA